MATRKTVPAEAMRRAVSSAGSRPGALEVAQARLREMIAEREREVSDGGLEIAIAIASVSSLVTVDASQDPFAVDPTDLGDRTFADPRVGISSEKMAIFKSNLKRLLPQIAADLAQIPEHADLRIADVAEFIHLSLMRR